MERVFEMVYMSYYGNPLLRGVPSERLVAISRKVPPDFRGSRHYKDLAPNWSTLERYKRDRDYLAYVKTYCRTRLLRLDAAKVAADLDGKIILCYERPGADVFCHRLIIQKWLQKHGFQCREILKE